MDERIRELCSMLPFFSPLSFVDLSSTCATTRVLQTRWTGPRSCCIEGKVDAEARAARDRKRLQQQQRQLQQQQQQMAGGEGAGGSAGAQQQQQQQQQEHRQQLQQDSWQGEVRLKHRCIRAVHRAAEEEAAKSGRGGLGLEHLDEYYCVLFRWRVCERDDEDDGSPDEDDDDDDCWGDLVFCNVTTKRWLVIETAGQASEELSLHARRMGHLLFGLLTYLGFSPEWVRCTTYTSDLLRLPPGLLDRSRGAGAGTSSGGRGGASMGSSGARGRRHHSHSRRHPPPHVSSSTSSSYPLPPPPSFFQVDFATFEPCLPASTMDLIDDHVLPKDQGVEDMVRRSRIEAGYPSLAVLKIRVYGDPKTILMGGGGGGGGGGAAAGGGGRVGLLEGVPTAGGNKGGQQRQQQQQQPLPPGLASLVSSLAAAAMSPPDVAAAMIASPDFGRDPAPHHHQSHEPQQQQHAQERGSQQYTLQLQQQQDQHSHSQAAPGGGGGGVFIPLNCSYCRKTPAEAGIDRLLRCSRCRTAFYCGRACQADHWKSGHRLQCRGAPMPEGGSSGAGGGGGGGVGGRGDEEEDDEGEQEEEEDEGEEGRFREERDGWGAEASAAPRPPGGGGAPVGHAAAGGKAS